MLPWTPILEGVSSPAAVATGERRLTLFVRGQGGELLIYHREGNAWSEARSLGIPLAALVTLARRPRDRRQIYRWLAAYALQGLSGPR